MVPEGRLITVSTQLKATADNILPLARSGSRAWLLADVGGFLPPPSRLLRPPGERVMPTHRVRVALPPSGHQFKSRLFQTRPCGHSGLLSAASWASLRVKTQLLQPSCENEGNQTRMSGAKELTEMRMEINNTENRRKSKLRESKQSF